jgi:hypothetical protein
MKKEEGRRKKEELINHKGTKAQRHKAQLINHKGTKAQGTRHN